MMHDTDVNYRGTHDGVTFAMRAAAAETFRYITYNNRIDYLRDGRDGTRFGDWKVDEVGQALAKSVASALPAPVSSDALEETRRLNQSPTLGITSWGLREARDLLDNICVDFVEEIRDGLKIDPDYFPAIETLEHYALQILVAGQVGHTRAIHESSAIGDALRREVKP